MFLIYSVCRCNLHLPLQQWTSNRLPFFSMYGCNEMKLDQHGTYRCRIVHRLSWCYRFWGLDRQLISNSICCAPMALPLDVDELVTKLKILGSPKVPWLPLRGVISMQACIFTASSDVKYNFGFLLHLFCDENWGKNMYLKGTNRKTCMFIV